MRPTGSQDEIGLVAWETHSWFTARSQEARRTMNPVGTTSTGLQHPHSENDDR